eukprot:5667265-Prymnesium_polylepis.1
MPLGFSEPVGAVSRASSTPPCRRRGWAAAAVAAVAAAPTPRCPRPPLTRAPPLLAPSLLPH